MVFNMRLERSFGGAVVEQAPLTSEVLGSILAVDAWVSQRSAESRGFPPGAPVG